MSDKSVTLYFGKSLGRYGFGDEHPFGPDRIQAFWKETLKRGLDKQLSIATPQQCSDPDLLTFHAEAYVARVKHQSVSGSGYPDEGDKPAFKGVYEAASTVVGSVLDGKQVEPLR
ncbi:MAG: hypothetical protein P8163_17405 [Candidatus Thiodiazotropha sp.]